MFALESEKIWSVSEITLVIKDLLEQSLYPFWLSGEIGNLTIHRSGHVYFSLKDQFSQINAVHFNGAESAREMKLVAGMEVEIHGRISVYEPRGNYQLNVKKIRPKGVGLLQLQFEMLKKKLQAEGLFAETRKKKLPYLPNCVGVITSPDGAALHDFLHIINRRFSNMHVRVYPASVQGVSAVPELVAGIEFLNRKQACDIIVITRGGGSIEDLWAFNDEKLAYAMANSKIPIISAVGHEVDYTICDFIADLRAPTPSAAAELVVGKRTDILDAITHHRRRINQSICSLLSLLNARVDRVRNHYILHEPVNMIHRAQQQIDEIILKITQSLRLHLYSRQEKVDRLSAQLRTLDPHHILARGYAILIRENDQIPIVNADAVKVGDSLIGILAEGKLKLTVTDHGGN